jgi:hypothetical protein
LTAELHRVTVRGGRPVDALPADPARASLTSALVRDDPVAALAAFDCVSPLAPDEQVWRAHALWQVGRVAEARALWASLLATPGPLEPALLTSLRARPEVLGPELRELDPERFLEANHALWRNTAVNHLGDPRARDALLTMLGTLDAAQLSVEAHTLDARARARACDLLTWRARAYLRAGEPGRARADLERAIELAADLSADTPQAAERWLLWLDLASLAAADGDGALASEAIAKARTNSAVPLLVGDAIRARPELAALTHQKSD